MEMISVENVNRDLIGQLFESAFFNTALDDKGSLFIKDKFRVYIDIGKKNQNITFSVYFNFQEAVGDDERKALVDAINTGLMQIKSVLSNNILTIEYDLWIEGGVLPKNIVLAYRSFVSQVNAALAKDEKRILL